MVLVLIANTGFLTSHRIVITESEMNVRSHKNPEHIIRVHFRSQHLRAVNFSVHRGPVTVLAVLQRNRLESADVDDEAASCNLYTILKKFRLR